jgi:hypothetical protein
MVKLDSYVPCRISAADRDYLISEARYLSQRGYTKGDAKQFADFLGDLRARILSFGTPMKYCYGCGRKGESSNHQMSPGGLFLCRYPEDRHMSTTLV